MNCVNFILVVKYKMYKLIAISGNRCVGKDTLYNSLKSLNNNFKRYAFADTLKRDLKSLIYDQFGIDIFNVTSEEKEFIRPILISYGSVWRERDIDHWCKTVCNVIKNEPVNIIPVITDLRFENELVLLRKEFGATLFHIHIERANGIEPTAEEQKNIHTINHLADYKLMWGDNTPEEILKVAKKICNM